MCRPRHDSELCVVGSILGRDSHWQLKLEELVFLSPVHNGVEANHASGIGLERCRDRVHDDLTLARPSFSLTCTSMLL